VLKIRHIAKPKTVGDNYKRQKYKQLTHYMKTIIILLGLALFISCNDQKVEVTTSLHADSLLIGDDLYYLDSISESDFKRIRTNNQANKVDTSLINVYKDSILIRTISKNVVYKNDSTDGESMVSYEFKSIIPELGYVHIKGLHWEWTTDWFINIKSGAETYFWDNPVLSPNKQNVITFSCDLEASFMPNGIQLYKINADTITQVFEKEIDNWGPEEVKWESDTSLVIKRLRLDKDMQPKYDYLRLKIK